MIVLALVVMLASSTFAGIVTAIATLCTAIGGVILAVSVLVPILHNTRATNAQVGTIHTIVNQQRTDAQRYNIALTELLKKHGIDVPVDQSLPVEGHADAQPGQPTSPGSTLDPRPPTTL